MDDDFILFKGCSFIFFLKSSRKFLLLNFEINLLTLELFYFKSKSRSILKFFLYKSCDLMSTIKYIRENCQNHQYKRVLRANQPCTRLIIFKKKSTELHANILNHDEKFSIRNNWNVSDILMLFNSYWLIMLEL